MGDRGSTMIGPIIMAGPVAVTVSDCRRRVAVLTLLLAALAARAQETDAPVRESPVRIPDIVITGADAIIIVPPLPVLPGGGIPVPPVALTPLRYRPLPADCAPPAGGDAPAGGHTAAGGHAAASRPDLCEPPALVRLQPFFLSGAPPRPAMRDLGVRYRAADRAGSGGGGGSGGTAGDGAVQDGAGDGRAARTDGRDQ